MKKTVALFFSLLLMISLAACGNSSNQSERPSAEQNSVESSSVDDVEDAEAEETQEITETLEETETQEASAERKILVAYFTYGENAGLSSDVDASSSASIQIFNGEVTGNTGVMAHMIAESSGGELFSIRTAEPYPDNYNDTIDVGESEKNNDIHPELSTHIENLEQYDTVFVGFPNWWYGMPMVMYSFFEEYDFSGKTVIPFCTSGGSAFSDAIDEIKDMEPDAAVLDGLHISSSSVNDAKDSVSEWVNELGLSK